MINLTLTDSTRTETLQLPSPPLVQADTNKDVVNTTLNNRVKVYIVPGADLHVWTQQWGYMSIADYNIVRGFRDRQRTLNEFPRLSITGLNEDILNVPVWLEMGEKAIIDNCETVENVTATFRES